MSVRSVALRCDISSAAATPGPARCPCARARRRLPRVNAPRHSVPVVWRPRSGASDADRAADREIQEGQWLPWWPDFTLIVTGWKNPAEAGSHVLKTNPAEAG